LPFFLVYNYAVIDEDCKDPRGPKNVKERIEKIVTILKLSINESEKTLVEFFNSIGINIKVNELINNFDPEVIIGNINIDRLSNNPRIISKSVIYEFLARSTSVEFTSE
jgi:hypothetical protein